ncbi:hypothetical protein GON09_000028 [Rhodococcus sp. B50]|nr:hypothetical protein [Rhodococcus sp. B50]
MPVSPKKSTAPSPPFTAGSPSRHLRHHLSITTTSKISTFQQQIVINKNQSDIKKCPRLMPASLTSAHRTRESSPGSVRRVAFSALTRAIRPRTPLRSCRVSTAVCSVVGVAVGSLPRWSRGRQTYAPAAGGRCPLALARSVPRLVCRACRLYRSRGLRPRTPVPPSQGSRCSACTAPGRHTTALPDPPTTEQGKTRPCPAVTAPGSPGRTDRPGTRSTTATEPPLHPQNRRSDPKNA